MGMDKINLLEVRFRDEPIGLLALHRERLVAFEYAGNCFGLIGG